MVGDNGEAFFERPRKAVYAPPHGFPYCGWVKSYHPSDFPRGIDDDLLKLVRLPNRFRMPPGAEPSMKDGAAETKAQINAVLNQVSGKILKVSGAILKDGWPIMEVILQFSYTGAYTGHQNTLQRKVETPMQLDMACSRDSAVICSKEWFHFDDLGTKVLG